MFESPKIWGFLLIIGVLIGLGYTSHYLTAVDDANAAKLDARKNLADSKEALSQRRDQWNKVEKARAKHREAMDKNTVLLKAKESLETRYRATDADLKYMVESMQTSVDKARNNAPGTELGDLTLSDGKMLRSVKIRKIEESGISLIHSEGIGIVSTDLLPAAINEKYDLGPNALTHKLAAAHKDFLIIPEGGTPSATPKFAAQDYPSNASAPPAVDDDKVKAIRLRIAEMDTRIEMADKSVSQLRASASYHQNLATGAKSGGKPSTRHTMEASRTLAQLAQVEQQVTVLRGERRKLEVELEFVIKGK